MALAAASSWGLPRPAKATIPADEGLAVAGGPGPALGTAWARQGRPNFVVIMADDLGFGELGAYGQELIRTPNLDRLAADGVRFTDFYAGSPICAPSRCSLLTGLHTGHSTVRHNPGGDPVRTALSPRDVTFGEVLQAVGYQTACIGKWGFGPERANQPSHPNARGFAEFFGYITHNHAHHYWPRYLWQDNRRVRLRANAPGRRGAYAPDLFADRATAFLERNRDRPFLLYFSPNLPHAPNEAPNFGQYRGKRWTYGNKAHASQITLLDAYVGRIVDKLRELGLDQNTIVVFTGDNGPHEEGRSGYDPRFFHSSGPLRGLKRNVYEGGIRVPMIAWSPGILGHRAGTVSDHLAALWDLFPTIADLADAPTPDDLDGRSARAALLGEEDEPPGEPRHLYWFRLDGMRFPLADRADRGRWGRLAEAVRQEHWKAVRFAPGRDRYVADSTWDLELYDLRRDIGETRNVAHDHPDVAAAMVRLMRSSWEEQPTLRDSWSPEGLSVDPPPFLVAGTAGQIATVFTNDGEGARSPVRLGLAVPDGWTAEPLSSPAFRVVEPGRSVRTVWEVTPTDGAAPGLDRHTLRARVSYGRGSAVKGSRLAVPTTVAPPAPARDAYLSDLPWIFATSAWGPVERDRANGNLRPRDGRRISLGGRAYRKGLGVHAPSEIAYYLGGRATGFTSWVGLDDFSRRRSRRGSVEFYVFTDDEMIYNSGEMRAATPPRRVSLDVTGAEVLKLVVTNARDTAFDHASWADARIEVLQKERKKERPRTRR